MDCSEDVTGTLRAQKHGHQPLAYLKPSNIMLCDDQKSVAIIDFGISSIQEDGNTIVKTKTGMTPEFQAHDLSISFWMKQQVAVGRWQKRSN